MIHDLQAVASASTKLNVSVVVIGAGIAGLMLAASLARQGLEVLHLESGPARDLIGSDDPLNIVEQRGQPYRGATQGRARGLGGTSRLWGGAMLPFLPCDMGPHTAGWPIEWPVEHGDLATKFSEVEAKFCLPSDSYTLSCDVAGTWDDSFILRSAKWPSFKQRNLTNTLRQEINDALVDVWCNATVTGFTLGENGRVASVTAESLSRNKIVVHADHVLVAAGAIESTRLLLLLDAQHDNRVFAPDGQLGRYFFDHLSTAAATIEPIDRRRLNATFGMKFEHGGMRDLRIEPSENLRRAAALPAAFAHIAAISDDTSGFAAVRDVYRSLQSRTKIGWPHVVGIARDLPWLVQAGWWRFARQRLLYPRQSIFELALVIEQMPVADSRIGLSTRYRDSLGVPRAVIDWRSSEADNTAFAALQERLCAFWNNGGFAQLGTVTPTARQRWQQRLQGDSDVFHPGGTTRMGRSVSTGVVDGDLRTFRVPNLSVVSTSAFPSGGGANPTFMLMAFALRAAGRLAKEERRGPASAVSASR